MYCRSVCGCHMLRDKYSSAGEKPKNISEERAMGEKSQLENASFKKKTFYWKENAS